jgi:hypothetical protein
MKLKRDGSILIGGVKVFPKWQWSDWYYREVVQDAKPLPVNKYLRNPKVLFQTWVVAMYVQENPDLPIWWDSAVVSDISFGPGIHFEPCDGTAHLTLHKKPVYNYTDNYGYKMRADIIQGGRTETIVVRVPFWMHHHWKEVDVIETVVAEHEQTTLGEWL